MDMVFISKLIKEFSGSSLRVVSLKKRNFSIDLTKDNIKSYTPVNYELPTTSISSATSTNSNHKALSEEIKSPIVGIYHCSFPEDEKCMISVGQSLCPGNKMGLIRAININTILRAERKMKILKVLVSNGQAVEYDQVLFIVEYE